MTIGQSEQKFQIEKFAGGGGKEKEPKTVKFKFGVSKKLSKKLKKLDLY